MAGQRTKRRKRRGGGGAPRAVVSDRRDRRAEQRAQAKSEATVEHRRAKRTLGTEGERPPGPFGDFPVSEILIFAGMVGAVVGFFQAGGVHLRPSNAAHNPALIVGLIVLALGVVEVTAREHFSGFRSHASLLAGIPSVVAGVAVLTIIGATSQRALILVVVVPLYVGLFWWLRRRFRRARQARVRRRP